MAVTVEPVIKSGGITWAEFECTTQWKRLTPSQKLWFMAFCASGDAVFAARLAFHCRSEINTRNLARQTEKSPRVVVALNLYRGKTEREIFLEQLKTKIDACEDGSIAQAKNLALYARLAFDVATPDEPEEKDASKNPAEPTPRFSVGDVVIQRGVRFRATKVSAEGKVLAAEEIGNGL
jgi:hypothetical protein